MSTKINHNLPLYHDNLYGDLFCFGFFHKMCPVKKKILPGQGRIFLHSR